MSFILMAVFLLTFLLGVLMVVRGFGAIRRQRCYLKGHEHTGGSAIFVGAINVFTGALLIFSSASMSVGHVQGELSWRKHEALRQAAASGDVGAVDRELNLHPELRDIDVLMPLAVNALYSDNQDLVVYFLDHGVPADSLLGPCLGGSDMNGDGKIEPVSQALRELVVSRVKYVDRRERDGTTLLHWAAGQGALENVKLLLAQGADPEVEDFNHTTPISRARKNKHPEVEALLLEAAEKRRKKPEASKP